MFRRLHIFIQALPQLTNLRIDSTGIATRVFLLEDADFQRVRARRGSIAGLFMANTLHNTIIVNATGDPESSLETVQHEYVHFAIQAARRSNVPAFYEEGLAQFMESFRYEGMRYNWGYFPRSQYDSAASKLMPLSELLVARSGSAEDITQRKQSPFYARSLLLMHYCMLGNAGCRGPYLQLASRIADGTTPDVAFEGAFGEPTRKLDERLDAYLPRAEERFMSVPVRDLDRNSTIRAIALPPGAADVEFGEMLLEAAPDDSGLVALFELHAANPPMQDRALAGLAMVHELHNRRAEADEMLDRLAALPDASAPALSMAGEVLFDRAQDDDTEGEALANILRRSASFYDAALDRDPGSMEALFGRGVVEIYLRDDLLSSAQRLASAYESAGKNPDIAMLLALHFDALGEKDAARTILRTAACAAVSPRMRKMAEAKLGPIRCYNPE